MVLDQREATHRRQGMEAQAVADGRPQADVETRFRAAVTRFVLLAFRYLFWYILGCNFPDLYIFAAERRAECITELFLLCTELLSL